MRVLWISNIVLPEAERLLRGNGDLKSTGGWMIGAAQALVEHKNVELFIACPSREVRDIIELQGKSITHILFPLGKGNMSKNHEYKAYWKQINEKVRPDVVHIHGTEYSHGLAYLEQCGNCHVVISIQGLTSVYAGYYIAGLNTKDILTHLSIRDILRGSLLQEQKRFYHRGQYEVEMLKLTKHVIGRTSWDKAHCWAINPQAKYHFNNETLRESFYESEGWEYKSCVPHSIFVSQATYPIKGLHQLLLAMPLIMRTYPDTVIRVAGRDITQSCNLIQRLRLSGYGKIIRSLIQKYKLNNHVIITGGLSEQEMKQEYLRANVFVMPSSIENSPNSLGEAQILGVPCVAAFVGGVKDMIPNDNCGLMYRFEEWQMLAKNICDVFASSDHFSNKEMREVAAERHNREKNAQALVEIYRQIIQDK